jgi:CTP:molybdopterin cytidylyltransferase MocA
VPKIVYIVLASGSLTREGFLQIFEPVDGRSALGRVAETLGEREAFVVVPPEKIEVACQQAPLLLTIGNDQPDRGLSYGLKVALAAIPPDRNFAVLYGDVPLDVAMLERLEDAFTDETDVVYPTGGPTPGYPLLFGPAARSAILALPNGDSIDQVRENTALRRVAIA